MRTKATAASAAIVAGSILAAVLIIGRQYAAWLPVAAYTCDYDRRGVAWLPANRVDDMHQVCARWYFHSRSYALPDEHAVPILADWQMMERAAGVLPADYAGPLIVLNEPDQARPYGVDMAPETAVSFVAAVRRAYPAAQLVGPNAIDPAYVARFLDAWNRAESPRRAPFDICGLHAYGEPERLPSDRVTATAAHFAAAGHRCDDVWVTEYGYPARAADAYAVWLTWTADIATDPRVSRYFGYTIDDGGHPTADYDMIQDGRLTASGRGFVDGGKAVYQTIRSYP